MDCHLCPAGELPTTTYQGIVSYNTFFVKYTQFSPAAAVLKVHSPEVHQEFCSSLCFSGFEKFKPFQIDSMLFENYTSLRMKKEVCSKKEIFVLILTCYLVFN